MTKEAAVYQFIRANSSNGMIDFQFPTIKNESKILIFERFLTNVKQKSPA